MVVFAGLAFLASMDARATRDPAAETLLRAKELMQTGRYQEAASIYTELVRLHPRDPGLKANLGMAQHLAGQHENAVRQLEPVLMLQPKNAPVMLMLGSSYLQLGNPRKAVALLQKAISLASDVEEGHQLLAEALVQDGRYQDAARKFERWSSLDDRDPRAWYGLGRCYDALARAEFELLLREAPESGYALALVARSQQLKSQYRSAFHLYREALKRGPTIRGLHLALGEIYAATGHNDWAVQERAKEQALGVPQCDQRPRECAFHLAKFREAAAPVSEPSLEATYWRTRALSELARQSFQRVVELGNSVESHGVQATMERERGRTAESIAEWKAALALSPNNLVLQKELAITLRLHEDYQGAREIVERLLAVNPDSAELNYLMGQIVSNQQQPELAIPFLEKVVRAEPEFLPARSSLGLALLRVERETDAIPHLRAALSLDADGSLNFRLARAYQKLGLTEAANQAFARYKELQTRVDAQPANSERESQITRP
ncbi:MAG: tetratricopeptide repeat protein [Acidobacteriota bacterium]